MSQSDGNRSSSDGLIDDTISTTQSNSIPLSSSSTPIDVHEKHEAPLADSPSDSGSLQHILRPRLQRGKQQRRTTYTVPSSPKKDPNNKPFMRARAQSPRRQSSPAHTPVQPSPSNSTSSTSTEQKKRPMGGRQVLPVLPANIKLNRRSLSSSNKNSDNSKGAIVAKNDKNDLPNSIDNTDGNDDNGSSLLGFIFKGLVAIATVTGGAVGVWYYYTHYVPGKNQPQQSQEQKQFLFEQ